jgi:ribosomal protein L44E
MFGAKDVTHAARTKERLEFVGAANHITRTQLSFSCTTCGAKQGDCVRIVKTIYLGQAVIVTSKKTIL